MSNDFSSENIKNTTLDVNPIGPKLKNAREALRLTVLDIARQLRLKPECIEALENDYYADMPGATFVKGYLRAYSVLVNLSGDELIADFDRLKLMPERQTVILPPQKEPMSFRQKPVRLTVFIGISLLVLIAIWWNVFSDKDATPPLPQQQVPGTADQKVASPAASAAMGNNAAKTSPLPNGNEKTAAIQGNSPTNVTPEKSVTETSTASTLEAQSGVGTDDAVATETDTVKKPAKKPTKSRAKLAEPFE
jgi:cytoskeleton protein RodZ